LRDPAHDQTSRQALVREFQHWQELGAALARLAASSPQLQDAQGAAANLAELGAAGQEALTLLAEGKTPTKEWSAEKLALLDRAASPQGLLRLAVVPALRALVLAAGGFVVPGK